jgi:hypothetical protein
MAKLKKRIQKELETNPAWNVDAAGAWLCPYCGEPVLRTAERGESAADAALARASGHLERCRRFEGGEGRTLPLPELSARAAALRFRERVRKSLLESPSWQLYDVARRWYCPFCAQATPVAVPEGGRVSAAALREIERHIASCLGFAKGKGPEKPLGYLRSMVAYANRTRKMAEQIRRKIEADAAWRLRDAEGRWVCPYCRKVQEHIDFSAPLQMVESAPLEIARHLFGACDRFREAQSAGAGAGGGAAAQSSATLEIARLGAAPTTDLVRLSGSPPEAVSGEFGAVAPEQAAAILAAAGAAPPPPRPLDLEASDSTPSSDDAFGGARAKGAFDPARFADPLAPAPGPVPPPPAASRADAAPRAASRRGEIEAKITAVRSIAEGDGTRVSGRLAAEQPPLPDLEGLEVRTFFRGAHPHPLDFADAVALEGRRVALVAGGVSGEGAETGLVLPMVKNLFRMHAKKTRSPADVLRRVNADLFADLDGKTYVAALYGVIDGAARTFRFARGGTEPPLVHRPGATPDLEVLETPGMVLGIDRGSVFERSLDEREVPLAVDDMLVLLTHGTVAAEDVDGREIGVERFRDLVRRYGRHEADYLIAKLTSFFEDWTRGAALSEDACVLAVKVKS